MNELQVIGIDFGGTSVKLAVLQGEELLTTVHRIRTQEFVGSSALIEKIVEVITEIRKEFPGVAAVGIGVPGAVDYERGITYNLTNVEGWNDVALRDILAKKTGLPCVLDNDANCMAFAEWKYGAAEGTENAVCVTLGTGVGGGLILNGGVYRGATHAAGEIGQMSVDYRGVPGPYGNSGALERYIGNKQITDLAAEMYRAAGKEVPDPHTPDAIAKLANEGDETAIAVWNKVAEYLANCLMSIVYLLNPEAIVIGGGVSEAGDLLFMPLLKNLENSLTDECFDHLRIVPAKFGNSAGMIGCAALAADLL